MAAVKKGLLKHSYVTQNIISNLEHGNLGKVNAIVLHRTAASTATSTLNAWKKKKSGTHFLVGKDGKIYQTANLTKKCWHMGHVMSKCRLEKVCTKKDLKIIKDYLFNKKKYGGLSKRWVKVRKHEQKKNYPNRYPMNSDSIGIEVVGRYLGGKSDTGVFVLMSCKQSTSLLWLVEQLLDHYSLVFADNVYAHGDVAHKKINEGVGLRNWLKDFFL